MPNRDTIGSEKRELAVIEHGFKTRAFRETVPSSSLMTSWQLEHVGSFRGRTLQACNSTCKDGAVVDLPCFEHSKGPSITWLRHRLIVVLIHAGSYPWSGRSRLNGWPRLLTMIGKSQLAAHPACKSQPFLLQPTQPPVFGPPKPNLW